MKSVLTRAFVKSGSCIRLILFSTPKKRMGNAVPAEKTDVKTRRHRKQTENEKKKRVGGYINIRLFFFRQTKPWSYYISFYRPRVSVQSRKPAGIRVMLWTLFNPSRLPRHEASQSADA
jgi:hypothetical protein